jgi:hypothetical protein
MPAEASLAVGGSADLVRKVNADDKQQTADLIALGGGRSAARAARHWQGHIGVAAEQAAPSPGRSSRAWRL